MLIESKLSDLGRRAETLCRLVEESHPNSKWISDDIHEGFVKLIDSSTTQPEEDIMASKMNTLIDSYEWRFGQEINEIKRLKQLAGIL